MADAYTTVRVKKATRDLINEFCKQKTISPDDAINLLLKSTKDVTKQILIIIYA